MKKYFTLLIMLLSISAISYAQDTPTPTTEHLTFSGITICGSATSFRSSMESKGFISNRTDDDETMMVFAGDFIGKSTELIVVYLTPKTKQVWKVVVYFIEKTSWYDLKNEYNTLKDQVIQKYGNPNADYDFFSSPYDEGDGYEMTGVAVDKCNYAAYWDNGISVEISKLKSVKICYEDPIQVNILKQEKSQMAQEGL